ncbi:hypothetical protein BDQ17DRAFT_1539915 [Cyathus striatus]|nr:hypothetical protein BDQ17DRAFT_1539915 [Cyathus striatus]
MDCVQQSTSHLSLHRAAVDGDSEGVLRALRNGADINSLDAAGRTAIMCAITGENWESVDASNASFLTPKRVDTIRTLLAHPDISLYTLNTPHASMNGVIPLGMAAWLNMPTAVRLLLEESGGAVSVNGMDAHGATALMYAARDRSLDVVQLLLSHGARPDFRDGNHRTSVQFSLAHPQILWLCESALRRHRWRESESEDRTRLFSASEDLRELSLSALPLSDEFVPPPLSIFAPGALSRLTDTIVSSVHSSDVSFLHSLLFSPALPPSSSAALYPMSVPVLVNYPDAKGWSPIHYCAASQYPSIEILDALYCAGADVTLFTAHEQFTALHVLAQSVHVDEGNRDQAYALYEFTVHLIQDLRAPLSARDMNDETCIHVAAEHGHCVELLMILLDHDTTGAIRELKNSRGLTALEVAKPEFRVVFGAEAEQFRSTSALSNHTIRMSESFASLASFVDWNPSDSFVSDDSASFISSSAVDIATSIQTLISNLRITSPSARHRTDFAHVDRMENLLSETTQLGKTITEHFCIRIQEVLSEIEDLQKNAEMVTGLRDAVARAADSKLVLRGLRPLPLRNRNRDSEDSQLTTISQSVTSTCINSSSTSLLKTTMDGTHTSRGTQTAPLDDWTASANGTMTKSQAQSWSTWLEGMIHSTEATTYKAYLASLWEIEQELLEHEVYFESGEISPSGKQLLKRKRKIEDKIRELEQEQKASKKSVSKIKAWFKRIIVSEPKHAKMEVILDVDEETCPVGRQAKPPVLQVISSEAGELVESSYAGIDGALRTSCLVLEAARRDLNSIDDCLQHANSFVTSVRQSLLRIDRVMKRAIKKREDLITQLRLSGQSANDALLMGCSVGSPGHLGYQLASCPSFSSISSIYSSQSVVSVAATVSENDDEETRIIRRILLRKIEAQTSGACEEVDKAISWLRIVKEVVRGVRRRAYL